MNEDPLTVTLTQISQLVSTLNKKNLQQSSRQIGQLVKEFGFEADRHYLRCLFSAVDFGDAPQALKSSLQAKLLNSELTTLISKPNYVSHICYAIDHGSETQKSLKPNAHLFTNLTKALNLTLVQEVVLAHSLTHSDQPDLRHLANDHLQASLLKLIQTHIEVGAGSANSESGLHDITPELLQLLLSLLAHDKYEGYGIEKRSYDKFIEQLCRDFPRDHVPLVLAPLLYSAEDSEVGIDVVAANTQTILQSSPIMDTSWSKLVMEIGYAFTASVDECKNHLLKGATREIKTTDVAKIVAMMCQTHTGLSESSINLATPGSLWPATSTANGGGAGADKDGKVSTPGTNGSASAAGGAAGEQPNTWKPEVLVQALKEVAPGIKWEDVCIALDHPEFVLKDRQGLVLLLNIVRLGYPSQMHSQPLPAQTLYRHWENSSGQLSLIYQILKNPDLISFADYVIKPVITDPLKTPPELDNKEVATWKSLHLIEVLLHIANNGFYTKVTDIFKIPIQLCPDLFFLALLQINTVSSLMVLRHELFVRLMPIFLGNHPNSTAVIQHAWNTTSLKPIVLNSIIEWYYRGDTDQARLSRILDVAQDLKALSSFLTVHAFNFSIDLACLASRRGYLKLDKYWNDQVREHRQPFIQATMNFLHRKCPQSIGGKIPDDQLPKAVQLAPETIATLMTCLQSCIGNVSPELNEMILTMSAHCNMLLNSTRQQQQQQQLPPPAVLRAAVPPPPQQPPPQQMRALESQFNATNLGGQIFANQNVDAFASAMSGLNLGGAGGAGGANNNFNFNMLSNIVTAPVSPSRLLNSGGPASHSPFSVMAAANQSMNLGAAVSNRIQPTPPTGDKLMPNQNTMFPDIGNNISKEIEDEANSYFQRIYNHPPHPTLSIDEVLDMLQRFQESPNRRERGVYQCMVRNLFEEYRFFPNYPDKELQITAQLFGGMVDRKLVTDFVVLGLALRCVLDALRKPEGSKMYFFGITALDRFKTKLHMYQKYCEHVRSIAHFDQFPPHLIEYVDCGVNGQEPPSKPTGTMFPPLLASTTSNALYNRSNSVTSNLSMTGVAGTPKVSSAASGSAAITQSRVKSIASATNIDTLLVANQDREEKIVAPPDAIQDKTAFIFNNLSQLNLQQKCEEVKEIMTKEYWSWLAQYLVLKRASIEFNFHTLYSNFLDVLKIPEINRLVTREAFRNIRVLLRSDKSIANFSDRSLLKNLGHWLGMMTLGRSRPILQIDIDLKSLLAEAYLKGQQELLYIVPFVAKVLESCAKSRVFKLPNPWTMAIMNVLAELHQEPDLKLNLKFEIEVLCKNFNIDVSDLKAGNYLKEADKNVVEFQLSQPDKSLKDVVMQSPIQHLQQSNVTPNMLSAGNMLVPGGARAEDVNVMNATVSPSPGLDGSGSGAMVSGPPEPKFSYMSINVSNLNCIGQLMTIAPNMPMFHAQPHLKSIVRVAIERTIGEWLTPVADRSVKIALTTCEKIIRKDFALDMEEMHMRTAAHYMVRNLTAGMAMITCREQLSQALITNVKNALLAPLTPQQKELAENAALQVAADNMELACAFIQKSAIERAVLEIDNRLAADYEMRKHGRMEGRTILDQKTYTYQCERMPEQIRLTSNITKHQFAVYEEFVKNIPGFMPITGNEVAMFFPKQQPQAQAVPEMFAPFGMNATAAAAPTPASVQGSSPYAANFLNTTDEILSLYDELMTKMDTFIMNAVSIPALQVQMKNIHTLYEIHRRNRADSSLQSKAVEFLLEGYVNMPEHVDHIKIYRDILLLQLRILSDDYDAMTAKAIFECREEIRYNLEAIDVLITSNFINMEHFDLMLSRSMENGNNYLAVNFSMKLVQRYLIDRSFPIVGEKKLANTIDMLTRISVYPAAPEGLVHLMEILRMNQEQNLLSSMGSGPPAVGQMPGGMLSVRGAGTVHDDASMQQKIEYLLKDWVTIFHTQARDPNKALSTFLGKLNVYGVELLKFLQQAIKICIDLSYRQLSDQTVAPATAKLKIFHWIDPLVRLVTLLMKLTGSDSQAKVNMLTKVLCIMTEALLKDHEKQGVGFQQVGFHRMLIMLFLELSAPDPVLESISLNVVTMFAHAFHLIRPMMAPGFCYAWLELISHRVFLSRCLAIMNQQKGWSIYSQLLLDLFTYLAPFLRNAELAKPVHLMYKGTLRILLVLLHDFPEFLCDYHFSFCDVIPPNCIQMRNLILSAFPRNMRMPDPFTPNLKVDMLAETANPPRILTNFAENITPIQFRQSLDSYLKTRAPVTFLSELRGCLQISNEPGSRYNIPLMNALVLYVGTQAIAHIRSKNLAPNMNTIVHSAHMDIFQNLSVDLENEGRYLFLNAIANQLRYPNSHTNYFSCVLLYLFVEANSEAIQEQITRVLVERLIVNRPHPWGLLITFIELIKNPVYKFWDHEFVHCAPEMTRLFESVARSCSSSTNTQQLGNFETEQECN